MTLRRHVMLKSGFIVGLTRFSASLSETTMWKQMKILSYCQRQKCSPGTLVSGDIRFMRIFARVLAWGGVS